MAPRKMIHNSVVSYQKERRTIGGEYGVFDVAGIMKWPGLNASFGVEVDETYAEIAHTSADVSNIVECVRNVKTGENLPFHLETHPQDAMNFPLLRFIVGSEGYLTDHPDSTSWLKELDNKYSVFTGVMFEDYKCEIPERGVVKETISGFAGHRKDIVGVSPAVVDAVENTSGPRISNDITSLTMGSSPNPGTSIAHCVSDISFGFTNEIVKNVHPESGLTTKICGVRVLARKMYVSLKLTWVDQTFIDIVTSGTKQYMKLVMGTSPHLFTIEFGGLIFPKYIAKAEPKELVGDTITCIVDQPVCTFSFADYVAWVEKAPKLGAETGIYSMVVLNGKIYGGTNQNGKLYEWNGTDAWVEKAPTLGAETYIYSMVVLNGKIYGGTNQNGKLYEWNGTDAWVEKAPTLGAETRIYSMAVLNGKIYGGTDPNGKLYEWNGTDAWVEKAPTLGAETRIHSMVVLNGKIYGGTNPNGKLYEWNGTDAWVEKAPKLGAETYIPSMAVLNGKIYGGTYPNGKLYEWNGTDAWVEKAPTLGAETGIYSMAVLNGKIYGGTNPNGKLYEWNGTDAWVEKAPKLGAETLIYSMAVLNGKIYGGTYPNGKLYAGSEY